MADAFKIWIDLDRLGRRLKWNNGQSLTRDEVLAWLGANDFIRQDDDPSLWVAEEISVEELQPDEFKAIERLT